MDLYQLECFRVVAKMQHISNAATQLNVTQSALSKIINRVEDYAGTPLFDRVKGRLYLNRNGEIFLNHLNDMFAALYSGLDEIKRNQEVQNYQIYVASNADNILFNISEDFFATHPTANIKYCIMDHDQISGGFQNGKLDIALTTYPMREPGITWTQVLEEELLLIVSPSSPYAAREKEIIPFSDLKDTEIMCESLGGDLRTIVDRCCVKAGFHANVVLESDIGSELGFHKGLSRAVTFMPAHRYMQIWQTFEEKKKYNEDMSKEVPVAIRLKDPVPVRITGIAKRSESEMTSQAEEMYEYIKDYFCNLNTQTEKFMHAHFPEE